MKIIITNAVMCNGGDAAILLGLIKILQISFGKEIDIVVYDSQPEAIRELYPSLNIKKLFYYCAVSGFPKIRGINRLWGVKIALSRIGIMLWSKGFRKLSRFLLNKQETMILEDYESADLIISNGGTYLVENYGLTARILEYQIASAIRKPLAFFTQSLGPFRKPKNRQLFRKIFNNSLCVFLRDQASFNHLKEIGIDHNKCHIYPDVAFALLEDDIKHSQSSDETLNNGIRVAISVRDWPHFQSKDKDAGMQDYLKAVNAALSHLINNYNAEVHFISTCQGISMYRQDDSKTAKKICNIVDQELAKKVDLITDHHTPIELIKLLNDYDLVIATRMHMAIMSIVAGTPVLPISYEFKTKELFNTLNLGYWVENIEHIEPDEMIKKIDEMLAEIDNIRETVNKQKLIKFQQVLDSGVKLKSLFDNISDNTIS